MIKHYIKNYSTLGGGMETGDLPAGQQHWEGLGAQRGLKAG